LVETEFFNWAQRVCIKFVAPGAAWISHAFRVSWKRQNRPTFFFSKLTEPRANPPERTSRTGWSARQASSDLSDLKIDNYLHETLCHRQTWPIFFTS